ncbi:MAG: Ig-like domain-containing protein [Bacteroidota bacterium]
MNIIKHVKLFLLTLVFGLPAVLSAQQEEEIYQGQAYDWHIINANILAPRITDEPTNGRAYWSTTNDIIGETGFNTLIYEPADGFKGEDQFSIQYYRPPFVSTTRTFTIMVLESEVFAMDDYTDTEVGTAVRIPILNNDTQTNGTLSISDILVAAGASSVSVNIDNTITFNPLNDFEGIAYVEYLVCNEAGACDNATVSINVEDNTASTNDTLQIYTKKNTAQPILMSLEDFDLAIAPEQGIIDNSEDVWYYVPNENTIGKDVFTYTNGVATKIVNVEIIDAEADNEFAIDDYAYTPINQAVEINFLENDIEVANFSNVQILQQPNFGTITEDVNGVVTYQPNENFSTMPGNPYSIDRFTYQATKSDGSVEQATVFIYVNDFNPSASTFELSVAKNSPLAIQYAVPIDYYNFEIVSQGDLGTVEFFESIDQEVYGQQVNGQKVLLYTPQNQVVGYDEFEVQYCVTPNADCKSIKIKVDILDIDVPESEQCVLNGCVWEGDTNNDGVVDMQDLLALGYAIGKTGASRTRTQTSEWYGNAGSDWEDDRYAKANLKYADTDGNGIINAKDTSAISANFGRKHTLTATALPGVEPLAIFSGRPDTIPVIGPGSILEIPLMLGIESFPVLDAYGIVFDVSYSSSFFREGTVSVVFDEDSWFSYGSANLTLSKEQVSGRIDAASTRTNLNAISGHGKIAKISGTTIEDFDPFRLGDKDLVGRVHITATAINSQGQQIQLGTDTYTFKLDPTKAVETTTEEAVLAETKIDIFPNPTAEVLNLSENVARLEVFTLTGQRILEAQNTYNINVENWNDGIYILRAYTEDGKVVNQKFEVSK